MSTLVLQGDTSGSITIQPAGSGSGTLTLPSVNSTLLNSTTLAAGTTTSAPLTFTSGTSLTTATAGSWEYDGKILTITPQSTQRGILQSSSLYYLSANRLQTVTTNAQSFFGLGVTVSDNTVYDFEAMIVATATGTPDTQALNLLFGGTAVVDTILYHSQSVQLTTVDLNAYDTTSCISASDVATVSIAIPSQALGVVSFFQRGTVSFTTGGTFIPQLKYGGTINPALQTYKGSYFSLYPLGAGGADISVGTWS